MANIRPEKQAAVAGLKEQLSSAKGADLSCSLRPATT